MKNDLIKSSQRQDQPRHFCYGKTVRGYIIILWKKLETQTEKKDFVFFMTYSKHSDACKKRSA